MSESEKRKAPATPAEEEDCNTSYSSSDHQAKRQRLAAAAATPPSTKVAADDGARDKNKEDSTDGAENLKRILEECENDPDRFFEIIRLRLNESPNYLRECGGNVHRAIVLAAVMCDGNQLANAPDHLKDDKFTVIEAVKRTGHALEHASERLRDDREVVKAALKHESWILSYTDRGSILQFASKGLQDDKTIVLHAVQKNGKALKHASEGLRDDPQFVRAALKADGSSLEFASERFRDDEEMVRDAMRKDGYPLQFASKRLRDDKQLVKTALGVCSFSLQYASDRLKNDQEVVEQSIEKDPECFCYASKEIKTNTDCVLRLVAKNPNVVQYIGRKMVLAAVRVKGTYLLRTGGVYESDREIVSTAIKQDPSCWWFASDELKADRQFVLEVVEAARLSRGEWLALECVLPIWRADRQIVLQAVHQNWREITCASSELWCDPEIISYVLGRDDFSLCRVSLEMRSDFRFVLAAVQCHDGRMRASAALDDFEREYYVHRPELFFASDALRDNPEIVLAAVRTCGAAIEFASDGLKGSREVAMAMVQSPDGSLAHVKPEFQEDLDIAAAAIRSPGFHISELPATISWVRRLLAVVSGLKEQIEADQRSILGRAAAVGMFGSVSFLDGPNARTVGEVARNYAKDVLMHRVYEKKWMLQQIRPRVDEDNIVTILNYAGIKQEIGLANELIRLAPIFAAFASQGISWAALPVLLPQPRNGDE